MKAKKIMCVVGYDISNDRKRSRVEKLLSGVGVRVNRSLFECMVTPARYAKMLEKLPDMIDKDSDKIVIYRICVDCYSTSTQMPSNSAQYQSVKIF